MLQRRCPRTRGHGFFCVVFMFTTDGSDQIARLKDWAPCHGRRQVPRARNVSPQRLARGLRQRTRKQPIKPGGTYMKTTQRRLMALDEFCIPFLYRPTESERQPRRKVFYAKPLLEKCSQSVPGQDLRLVSLRLRP